MGSQVAALLVAPLLLFTPGCLALAVTVATSYLDEPAPELTRHYAVDLDTAYAACLDTLVARGYPTPVEPPPPEGGAALIHVHDVTVRVSRLTRDLTRVQASLGGFSRDEVRRHTERFLTDLDRLLH